MLRFHQFPHLRPAAFCAVLFLSFTVLPHETTAQVHHAANKNTAKVAKDADAGQTILGDVVPFGDGTARAWVKKDLKGNYESVGITLTEKAMEGLPTDITPGLIWMVEYILKLPSDKNLPFNHIGVNWNPKGHMPSGVYNVPHFDFHFYTITPEERLKITARGTDLDLCRKTLATDLIPEGYIFAPESEEPGMGGHWADVGSHEFHGKDFTSTFIYGSYDGKVIFWEPMITKSYIESKPNITIPIKLPKKIETKGFYPVSYSITFDETRKEYTVSFDGMVYREN